MAPQPVGPSRTRDGTCVPCIAFMDRVAGYNPFPGWNTLRGPRQLHECALSGRLPARPPRERRISHKGEKESAARPSCSPPPASSLGSPLRPSSPISPGHQCCHPGPSASHQPASLPPQPFQLRWVLSPGHTGKGWGPRYPRPCSPTLPSSAQAPPVCQAQAGRSPPLYRRSVLSAQPTAGFLGQGAECPRVVGAGMRVVSRPPSAPTCQHELDQGTQTCGA